MKEFSKQGLKEWELGIINDYPELFTQEPSPYVQSCIDKGYLDKDDWVNLRYGFECQSGWESLIRDYCSQVVFYLKLLRESGEDPDAKVYGCIIKEKFGTLRFQNDVFLNEKAQNIYLSIVRAIEESSASTCEITGKWGSLKNRGGNLKTVSSEAAYELGYS